MLMSNPATYQHALPTWESDDGLSVDVSVLRSALRFVDTSGLDCSVFFSLAVPTEGRGSAVAGWLSTLSDPLDEASCDCREEGRCAAESAVSEELPKEVSCVGRSVGVSA